MNTNYNFIKILFNEFRNQNEFVQNSNLSFDDQRSIWHESINLFPAIYAVVRSVTLNEQVVNWNLDIYFLDLLLDNRSNEQSIMNNTLEIANQFQNFIHKNKSNNYTIENFGVLTPLNNFDNNRMNGWRMNMVLETKREQCFGSDDSEPLPQCFPVILNANGEIMLTAPSGSEINLNIINSNFDNVGVAIDDTTFQVPDATYTIKQNGDTINGSIASGENEIINLPIPTPARSGIIKSGQTILVLPSDAVRNLDGMGDDWYNLDAGAHNANIFGHHKRFTNRTGNYQDEISGLFYDKNHNELPDLATAFPNGIVIDWFSRDNNGLVLGAALNSQIVDTRFNGDAYCTALVVGGISNWKLPNFREFSFFWNFGEQLRYNFRPFNNFDYGAASEYFWMRGSKDALTGSRSALNSGLNNTLQNNRSLEEPNRILPLRYFQIQPDNTLI